MQDERTANRHRRREAPAEPVAPLRPRRGRRKHRPFDPEAAADTIDGLLRSQGNEWHNPYEGEQSNLEWLQFYRSLTLKELRKRLPTGVVVQPGESRREATVRTIRERDGDALCHICGVDWPGSSQVEHIQPLACGGRHALENLGLAHPWCNDVKRTREDLSQEEARELVVERLRRRKILNPKIFEAYGATTDERNALSTDDGRPAMP